MTGKYILQELEHLICENVEMPEPVIGLSTTFKDDLDMDSLTQVDLVIRIERNFSITVPDEAVGGFVRVGDVVEYLVANLPDDTGPGHTEH